MEAKINKKKTINGTTVINVLVVDDSLTVRKKMKEIINKEPDMFVVAEAADGRDAVEITRTVRPDLIIMDVAMPVMDGSKAVEQIMIHCPTPIIICSSATNRNENNITWDALKAGALDKIEKNDEKQDPMDWEKNLLRTIRAGSRVKVTARREPSPGTSGSISHPGFKAADNFNLLAFGLSTGGPGIIAGILESFPSNFKLTILVGIHLGERSDCMFPEWLNGHCPLPVYAARDGMKITDYGGSVLVTPPAMHMTVQNNCIALLDSPPVNFCKPSVDVLFESLAQDSRVHPIAVLLTGIGTDGAKGLKTIRDSGGHTICQDETTSIVFGMPRAAIEMDAAMEILPSHRMAERIVFLQDQSGKNEKRGKRWKK